jgi:hypothetical protein
MNGNKEKKRYTIAVQNIGAGETHDEVYKVQRYLRRFGYLREGFEPRKLDLPTQAALRLYQERAGVKVTGMIDKPTIEFLEMPRCGVPDFPTLDILAGDNVLLASAQCSYKEIDVPLMYAIINPPRTFTVNDIRPQITAALDTWKAEINQEIPAFDFEEVSMADAPALTFDWVERDHGDGSPFDGLAGNILAHAFSPPPCGDPHAGKCHFDNENVWGISHNSGIIEIRTMALHEIGHLLGLGHSSDTTSVMFERYSGSRPNLTQIDIDSIRALYRP